MRQPSRGKPPVAPRRNAARRRAHAAEPAKPWFWLLFLVFLVSLGSNLYLGWIVADLRRRCRRLLAGRNTATAAASETHS